MEEIDDIAPLVHYNMLLSSLPMDKRGHEDFGAYLRADENLEVRTPHHAIRDCFANGRVPRRPFGCFARALLFGVDE